MKYQGEKYYLGLYIIQEIKFFCIEVFLCMYKYDFDYRKYDMGIFFFKFKIIFNFQNFIYYYYLVFECIMKCLYVFRGWGL